MKEYKYLYQQLLDEDLIRKAYKNLRKGKTKRNEIIYIDEHIDEEVAKMRTMVKNTKPPDIHVENPELGYRPKTHKPKTIFEHGKYRTIYMPDIHEQWLHHMIVCILEPIIIATSYPLTCGSFPKRGAHYGKKFIAKWIKSGKGIKYFAKIDIRHFYNNIRLDMLMRELSIRIKDNWFLHIISLCLSEFKKGIPLGFYISQWLANYILEPLDYFITEVLGFQKYVRYMDDMVLYSGAKKSLHIAITEIKKLLGRRFRLKLKRNHQVCRFDYKSTGEPLDFMGFVFYRNKILIRESIMLAATKMARKLYKEKRYFEAHVKAMLSYMGWFSSTDSYDCYLTNVKPYVNIQKLKKIVSKLDRRKYHETMVTRNLCGVS